MSTTTIGGQADAGPRARVVRAVQRPGVAWLLLPAIAALLVFFVYPLLVIVWRSFTEPSLGLSNYGDLLSDGVSVKVVLRTLMTSLIVASVTLVLAYPFAYAMTRASPRARGIMTVLVLLPFWTSLIARNFAWYLLEQRDGVIERAFGTVGLDGVVLLGTVAGVTVAMVQVMLPFMVLPLYSSMTSIDVRLLDAATSLGAPRHRAFRKIYLPLSVPGIVAGFSLVFILTLGFYITPALLGSPKHALVSQVIAIRVNSLLDFAGAGALGTVLLLITLVILVGVTRIARPSQTLTEGVERG